MRANQLPDSIPWNDSYMRVGIRHLDNNWGAEAEWYTYEEVTQIVYHHDNDHGERVFSIIGGDIPGYFEWACESDIMFVHDAEGRTMFSC